MPGFHGQFCWYELLTTDASAAERFYRDIVGWNAETLSSGPHPYTVLKINGDRGVAGLMTLPEEAKANGARPGWIGYIWVEDVDAYAARVVEKGGRIWRQAEDIPTVGRFAVVADPQGASFVLFKDAGTATPPPIPPQTPGGAGWRELMASDWEAAFAFYAELFGWTKDRAFDMGPMGTYQLFAVDGETVGGMMTKPADLPAPFWTYYFYVDGIGTAAERVKAGGGSILTGPQEVPDGSWVLQALDPQGAMFALVSRNT
ncbi:MAG: VOC family protein [Caulobacteraceae bacterium]